MDVSAPPAVPAEPELRLLPGWEDADRGKRRIEAAVGSFLVHVVLIAGAVVLAAYIPPPTPPPPTELVDVRKSVTLVTPRDILTQPEPNRNKIAKEIRLENLIPRPEVKPSPKVFSSPPASIGHATTPAAPPTIEAPQVNVAQAPPPMPGITNVPGPPAPPPPKPPQDKPKLAFETPGAYSGNTGGVGRIEAPPKPDLQRAMRNAAQPGPGDVSVGDNEVGGEGGLAPLPGQLGSQGRQSSTLELQSDPMGVDFRPYLTRVITAVRRNWFSVWPESARMGQRGRTVLLFSIDRSGGVPKLAIDTPSGTQALDRAAVAGISASTPFPPLPAAFKGDVIRLRLVFYYNIPRR